METVKQLEEFSLGELFAMADAVGNKYQTPEEIAQREASLAEARAAIDAQLVR